MWVLVGEFGNGLRELLNNRYLLAHAGHAGWQVSIDGDHKYADVFALCRGPRSFDPPRDPHWKLWLANGRGIGRIWEFPDSESLEAGWHHFVVRWDHNLPRLELLIDVASVIRTAEYRDFWPTDLTGSILFGTWPNRERFHYAETAFQDIQLLPSFVDDDWVRRRVQLRPSA